MDTLLMVGVVAVVCGLTLVVAAVAVVALAILSAIAVAAVLWVGQAVVLVVLHVVLSTHRARHFLENRFTAAHFFNAAIPGLCAFWALAACYVLIRYEAGPFVELRYLVSFGHTAPPARLLTPPVVDVGTDVRRYRLVAIKPPLYAYVTLQDVQTNELYTDLHVGKYCNNYSSNVVGQEFNLSTTTRQQGDKKWLEFNNLHTVFCGS